MRWLIRALLVVLVLALGLLAAAWLVPLPGEEVTPAGLPRNQALYVQAADGTRIAIDVWLPAALESGISG